VLNNNHSLTPLNDQKISVDIELHRYCLLW